MTALAIVGVVLVGTVSGFFAGLVGSAGTYLTLSLLTIVLGSAHLAVGTTVVYALTMCVWGSVAHLRAGRFVPGVAMALGVPAAGTAVLGAWIAEQLSDRALTVGVAALTAIVIVATLLGGSRGDRGADAEFRPDRRTYLEAMAGGLLLGLLQGMFGVGGGFLLVPFLVVALRMPTRLAIACSLVAGIPSLLAAGISHAVLGNVHPLALGALLVGALPFAWIGARRTGRTSPVALRYVILGMMSVSCVTLIVASL
jgi:uncharacterized membrane protein YfcA